VMTSPLQEQPNRHLHGRIVIHDQDVGHVWYPPGRMGFPSDRKSNHQL
jgi:hypothetical protein